MTPCFPDIIHVSPSLSEVVFPPSQTNILASWFEALAIGWMEQEKNWLRRSIVADICRWLSQFPTVSRFGKKGKKEREERYIEIESYSSSKNGGNLFQFLLIPVVHIVRAISLSLSARDKKSPLYCSFPFSDPSWRFSLSLSTRAYIGCWDPQSLFFSIASSTLNFFVLRGCKYLPSAVCCGAISQQRHKKQYGDLGEV